MSLVNRMLKDLSAREPSSASVMRGLRIETSEPGLGHRLVRPALILLAVLGAGALGWRLMQGPIPAAAVRPALPPAAADPPPSPASAAGAARFRLADTLGSVPAASPAPRDSGPVRESAELNRTEPTDAPVSPAPRPRASAPPASRAAPAAAAASPTAESHYAAAVQALEQGDVGGAERHLLEVRALDPAPRPAYRRLAARVALAQDRPAQALAELEGNVPPASEDPEYSGLLAATYQRLNRHQEASGLYRALVADQPEEGHWWAGYAISRDALGDRPEALKAYGQALQRGRLDPRVSQYIRGRLDELRP